ncbi:peptidase C39 family protein [Auraticoccus sp. F435]|uniref:Peptidase C39 family protein n=1 Tax=Auraticoccus cholistanensis TaxID=2656650 RepID=A0A6A9UUH2_9ACTN|nr:peptidase C39 family protein [Auraticoccus cholistanensis]MVA75224.1 peptidase C39 family protein [Auraticoccus cholistanensis]
MAPRLPRLAGRPRRLPLLVLALALGSTTVLGGAPDAAAAQDPIATRHWTSTGDWTAGSGSGTVARNGNLALDVPTSTTSYTDPHTGKRRSYEVSTWTSPRVSTSFGATELIASWNAATTADTFVEVRLSGRTTSGADTKWYVMGRWTQQDGAGSIRRTSAGSQSDDHARVATDTLITKPGVQLSSYRVQVRLHRAAGTGRHPYLRGLTVMASDIPARSSVSTSAPTGRAAGTVLAVPTYSQQVHTGHSPQFGGGGEAWCSPTSVAMVLDYWKLGPSRSQTSWLGSGHPDPQVDHAARYTYDYAYQGTGNWPMSTAYANHRGANAFVTRLHNLREAETFIEAGIPLVVSVSFSRDELDGAGYGTDGHLLVVVGFTRSGDVVVNDPASHLAKSNAQVRTTYDRAQFEKAWLTGSKGTTYVIAHPSTPLPRSWGAW